MAAIRRVWPTPVLSKEYSPLTSVDGGGDWVKGSDNLTAWDRDKHFPAGNISFGLTQSDGGKNERKSMHERSIEMLADQTERRNISQTGVVIDGPPYRSKIVDEQLVYIDPQNIQRGKKDIGLERLVVPGPKDQKINIIHYHERVGKYGKPTDKHDLAMIKKLRPSESMYFTNKAWAAHGKYQILQNGRPTRTFIDRRIIPPPD